VEDALEAHLAIARETPAHDDVEGSRDLESLGAHRRRHASDRLQHLGQARRLEGATAGDELEEDGAERPDVGASVDVRSGAELLRRGVSGRAGEKRVVGIGSQACITKRTASAKGSGPRSRRRFSRSSPSTRSITTKGSPVGRRPASNVRTTWWLVSFAILAACAWIASAASSWPMRSSVMTFIASG
jgi:hypothetical protein